MVVFSEIFQVVEITKCKTSSSIQEHTLKKIALQQTKKLHVVDDGFDDFPFFGEAITRRQEDDTHIQIPFYNKINKGKKNLGNYFYKQSPHVTTIDVIDLEIESIIRTDDADLICREYANPFSKVCKSYVSRTVRYKEDKNRLNISTFIFTKFRNPNNRYFVKKKQTYSVTINLESGDITFYTKDNNKPPFFCKNNFKLLNNEFALLNKVSSINSKLNSQHETHNKKEQLECGFNNLNFLTCIKDILSKHGGKNPKLNGNFSNRLMDFFATKRGVKMGDDYFNLIEFYPGIKSLRENNMNLTDTILTSLGIKSKFTKKLLNGQTPQLESKTRIDPFLLQTFIRLFGEDHGMYLSNIKDKSFFNHYLQYSSATFIQKTKNQTKSEVRQLTKGEKECVISIINDCASNDQTKFYNIQSMYSLIKVHIEMMRKCRKYYPNARITSTTINGFNQEHYELSSTLTKMRKLYSMTYVYEDETLNSIESPIVCMKDDQTLHTLKPFILKRDEDYIDEGYRMKHCVAGYNNRPDSMIVSLRNEDDTDRITIEYRIQSGQVVQERGKFNSKPDKKFEDGVLVLSQRIQEHARLGTLNWVRKEKVPVLINGIEVVRDSNGFFIDDDDDDQAF